MDNELLKAESSKEIEILEFVVSGNTYGANIHDVREILPYEQITRIPNSHPHIEGIIKPRDFLIPIINVAKNLHLTYDENENHGDKMVIVSSIDNLNIGFLVDRVLGMHRTSASNICGQDEECSTANQEVLSGILKLETREFEIIDLRKMIKQINEKVL